jgi:hypothetical protein
MRTSTVETSRRLILSDRNPLTQSVPGRDRHHVIRALERSLCENGRSTSTGAFCQKRAFHTQLEMKKPPNKAASLISNEHLIREHRAISAVCVLPSAQQNRYDLRGAIPPHMLLQLITRKRRTSMYVIPGDIVYAGVTEVVRSPWRRSRYHRLVI